MNVFDNLFLYKICALAIADNKHKTRQNANTHNKRLGNANPRLEFCSTEVLICLLLHNTEGGEGGEGGGLEKGIVLSTIASYVGACFAYIGSHNLLTCIPLYTVICIYSYLIKSINGDIQRWGERLSNIDKLCEFAQT